MKLFVPLYLSRLLFTAWHTPINWGVDRLVTNVDLNEQIKENVEHLYNSLQKRATFWHDESLVTAGGAIAGTVLNTQAFNLYASQATPANADTFTQSVVLAPGTYTLYLLGCTTAASGIVEWRLAGSLLGSHDWRSGITANNVIKTIGGIVVATGGRFVLEGKLNGTSGAGYAFQLTTGWFAQASD